MKSTALPIIAATALLTGAIFLSATSPLSAAPPTGLPEGEGKAIVERMCVGCHALNVVTSKRATPDQWSTVVATMVSRGAEGTDEEIDTVTRYLAANFAPATLRNDEPASAPANQAISSSTAPATSSNAAEQTSRDTVAPVLADKPADKNEAASSDAITPEPPVSTIHVNVNSAPARELESALSLSRGEAETLIRFREQNGKFKNWEEVGEVPGVPAGKIQEFRARLVF